MIPNTDAPNDDAPDDADNDAAYPYPLLNRKNKKNNITSNTDSPKYDAPDSSEDDDVSPKSCVLYSSLKHTIDPK